jgi:hypothetical protein
MSPEDAKKRLARLPEYVKHRQVDRLVETMVFCREFLTTEHDVHVRALVKDLYCGATRGKEHKPSADHQPDFKTFAWQSDARRIVASIAEPLSHPEGLCGVIASDRIEDGTSFRHCVAICNCDVIFQDGSLDCSILITTGRVLVVSGDFSFIATPGVIEVGLGGDGMAITSADRILVYGSESWTMRPDWLICKRDTEFFRTWKLYSSTEVGAKLWALFGVVGVSAVVPGSPCAKAGIRPGDILKHINGTSVRSVRDANRLLCRATVSWGVADVAVIRNRQISEVTLSLFHW